jgi:hypothetical protein
LQWFSGLFENIYPISVASARSDIVLRHTVVAYFILYCKVLAAVLEHPVYLVLCLGTCTCLLPNSLIHMEIQIL